MRAIKVVILLAAVGGGIWWWMHRKPEVAADDNPFSSNPVVTPAAALPAAAKKTLDEADALWAQSGGDPSHAPTAPRMAKLYSQVLTAMYDLAGNHDAEEKLVKERLDPLGQALFFSKSRWPDDPTGLIGVHIVNPGEGPDAIARTYGMSSQFLNRLRGKDVNDSNLRSGDALKVIKVKEAGGNRIEIDLSNYNLDLFIAGVFAKRYIISHGAVESPTPTGRTHIVNRVWHPDWTHPVTKKHLPYGDPENILGPVWMLFDAKELGASSIGIHGYTGTDGKMQARVSNGCIRMQNENAEELYQLLAAPDRAPTAVRIRP